MAGSEAEIIGLKLIRPQRVELIDENYTAFCGGLDTLFATETDVVIVEMVSEVHRFLDELSE